MVVGLVAPCAAVRLDVIEQLALSIAGDFSAVDRGGRVGAFEAGWEAGGLLVGRRGSRAVFWRDWSLSFFSLPGAGGSRLCLSSGSSKLVMGVLAPRNGGGLEQASTARLILAMVYV